MREMKFRAWYKERKKMFEVSDLHFEKGISVNSNKVSSGIILMQFTGLLDKNKKEVYEGDVLNWDNECTILIKWIEGREVGFGYEVLTQKDKNVVAFDIRFYRSEESAEVIGNKFEDSHLLKNG